MNFVFRVLANRYAKAFLLSFGKEITFTDFENIKKARDYLKKHSKDLFFLQLPKISKKQKVAIMQKIICKQFDLPVSFTKLFELLVRDKREQLLAVVFDSLYKLYQKLHNIESFSIESSSELTSEKLEKLKEFLARQTGADIIYTYVINPTLIAGLRMQSDTHYWEYSIKQQLKTIKQKLAQ